MEVVDFNKVCKFKKKKEERFIKKKKLPYPRQFSQQLVPLAHFWYLKSNLTNGEEWEGRGGGVRPVNRQLQTPSTNAASGGNRSNLRQSPGERKKKDDVRSVVQEAQISAREREEERKGRRAA